MSLQIAAKHLAAKGRGPDTTLVHMTNKEVQGLQALAEKNGGSLSINPDTGLPEAGFLESILPLVAGVGLAAAGMPAGYAALTVGGVTALSTGNLSKGLYAGLGAYGGASLGQQLAVQGMSAEAAANASFGDKLTNMGQNASFENIGNFISANPKTAMAAAAGPLLSSMEDEKENDKPSEPVKDTDPGARARSGIKYNAGYMTPTPLPNPYGIEQTYATPYYAAEGGVTHMAEGGTAYGGSTSGPIDTKAQFADYLNKVMNPTNRTNAVSGSTNPYEWWKSPSTPEAAPAAPAETAEEYAARTSLNARGGGGGPSAEEREAQLNEVNDYLSTPENPITMNQYWAMSSEDRAALDAAAAERNPIRAGIGDFVKTLGVPIAFRAIQSMYDNFTGPKDSTGGPSRYTSTATQATPAVTAPNINPVDPYAVDADYGMDKNITYTAKEQARIDRDAAVRSLQMAIERESPDSIAKYQAQVNDLNSKLAALNGESTAVTVSNINPVDPYAVDSDYVNTLAPASDAVAQTNAALTDFSPSELVAAEMRDAERRNPENFDVASAFVDPYSPSELAGVSAQAAAEKTALRAEDRAAIDKLKQEAYDRGETTYGDRVSGLSTISKPNEVQTGVVPASSSLASRVLYAKGDPPVGTNRYALSADALSKPYPNQAIMAMVEQQKSDVDNLVGLRTIGENIGVNHPIYKELEAQYKHGYDRHNNQIINFVNQQEAENAERGDRFAPMVFSPLRERISFPEEAYRYGIDYDTSIPAPDIVGINEIKAEADPNADNYAQILKTFDPDNADVAGLLAEPGVQLAAGANYTGGISDGSTLAGIPAPNVGYGQGRGAFGIGGVWTNREGVPITTRDGSPVMTGAGAEAMQRAVAESNAAANRTYGNSINSGPANDGRADPGGEGGTRYGSVAAGYTGGSEAAAGGLSTPYGFQRMAQGGISDPYNLGSYSDGGRLLRGPGDGVSDSIPATIGKGRPARLADGEFVIPARIVSEIGNGSTEAGARKLYAMMDRIQASRRNTVGKGKVAVNNRADKYLPA